VTPGTLNRAVALVTHAGLPALAEDEREMIPALAALGIRAVPAVWTDPEVPWDRFDAALVRSTWDYHLRRPDFLEWVERTSRVTRLWNPPSLLRWNSHKSYLRDLEGRGIPIVPTVWSDGSRPLSDLLAERGWSEAVIKPAVSAAAHRTYRVRANALESAEPLYRQLSEDGEVLVQPYLRSVERHGEHSLVFLDGEFSHGVDRPAVLADARGFPGDQPVLVPEEEREFGLRVLRSVTPPTLYARVDIARDNEGALCIMELELVEPTLYLSSAATAVPTFARAIRARL
jgi:glutathione synthase/RimK-type ligase-like ATP-grasp enzyme